MRIFIVLLALLVPVSVGAQELSDRQKDDLQSRKRMFGKHVADCSLESNSGNLGGPVKVKLTFDEDGNVDRAVILDKKIAKTDVGRCITDGKWSSMSSGTKFPAGLVRTETFEFHPWASRPKRTWKGVRKTLEKKKVIRRIQACVTPTASGGSRGIYFHFFVKPDGTIDPVYKPSGKILTVIDGEDMSVNDCFARVLKGLKFPPSGNKFVVGFEWGRDRSKPSEIEGSVVEPLDCELRQYPCTFADADPERLKLTQKYIEQYGKRVDCDNPKPTIEWLKKQPHVRSVMSNGCSIRLLVEGARPMWFHTHL